MFGRIRVWRLIWALMVNSNQLGSLLYVVIDRLTFLNALWNLSFLKPLFYVRTWTLYKLSRAYFYYLSCNSFQDQENRGFTSFTYLWNNSSAYFACKNFYEKWYFFIICKNDFGRILILLNAGSKASTWFSAGGTRRVGEWYLISGLIIQGKNQSKASVFYSFRRSCRILWKR